MTRNVQELLASKDWEHMSLYELELLRGIVGPLEGEYKEHWRAYMQARKRKEFEKEEAEKPYRFGLLEYVKQARQGTVEVDETLIREFYRLSEEEQRKVIVHLEQHSKGFSSLRGDGYDLGIEGYIPFKRLRAFIDLWLKEQAEDWVAHMMVRARTRVPLQEEKEQE